MPSSLGSAGAHLANRFADELLAGRVVPQHVDLVQHGEQVAAGIAVELADVSAPDVHVAGSDARIGGQHEQHGLGVGQHRQGQLRFAAQRVQAWSVENTQALAQQRMIETDQRMAPGRHQHLLGAFGALQRLGLEAQFYRLLDRHGLGAGDLGEGLEHALRVVRVQRDVQPVPRCALELRDAGVFQA